MGGARGGDPAGVCAAVMCECERVLYSLNTTVFACIHFGLCIWSEYTYSYLRSVYSPSRVATALYKARQAVSSSERDHCRSAT